MKLSLGLCCMKVDTKMSKGSTSPKTFDLQKVRFATLKNIDTTIELIEECVKSKCFYRASSNIIPFYEMWDWKNDDVIMNGLKRIKKASSKLQIFTMHPDQFIVLSSDSESVIEKSVQLYELQCEIANLIGCTDVIIHIGKRGGAEKFSETFKTLSNNAQQLTRIENCHYNDCEYTINLCKKIGIPFILDVHHARLTGELDFPIELIKSTLYTWGDRRPIAHISSGREHDLDKAHADYISKSDINKFLWLFDMFHVEVEAKKKELAILNIFKNLVDIIL